MSFVEEEEWELQCTLGFAALSYVRHTFYARLHFIKERLIREDVKY